MSFRTTYILFAVLIGLLGLLGLTLAVKKTHADQDAVFPSFFEKSNPVDVTQIDTVEIEQKGKDRLVFAKGKKGWRLEKRGLKLSRSVNALIRQVMGARREDDTDVTPNPEAWGLKDPAMVVVLKQGTREWKLKLGNQSPEDNGVVYVMSSDRPAEVLAVRRASLANVVNFKLDDIWSRELLKAGPLTTRELTVRGPVKEGAATREKAFTLRKKSTVSYWFVAPPFGPAAMEAGMFDIGGSSKQSPGVRGLLLAVNDLQAESLEPFDEHPLKWYGLEDGARVARITVTNAADAIGETAAGQETLLVNFKETKKNGKDEKQWYGRLTSGQAVFRISEKKLEPILSLLPEEGERLRSLQVIQLRPTEPDAIDIHTAQGDVQLRRVGVNDWKMKSVATGIQKADHVFIQQLLSELGTNHQVKGFQAPGKNDALDKSLGLSPPATTISIWVGGIAEEKKEDKNEQSKTDKETKKDKTKDKQEKKADEFPPVNGKPAAVLTFGSSGGKAYVKREVNGEINRVNVPIPLLQRAEKAPEAYLDRNLTSFAADQVIGLVRTRAGKTLEVSEDAKAKTWKLIQPRRPNGDAGVDKSNLTELIGQLAKIAVEQWVKVKPTEPDLKLYKLDNPRLKVEVKLKAEGKKEPTRQVFSFGDTKIIDKDRSGVYCLGKLGGDRDAVFLVHPALVQMLETMELRDRTVFHFAADKVIALSIKGWDDVKKHANELQLDLKRDLDKPWQVVKCSQAGFKLDEQRVLAIVDTLSDLKLARLLEAGPPKEYDLKDKANRTLVIEITLKDEKKPLTLVIGKQTGTPPLAYAESSTLPGEVFLLSAKDFGELLTIFPWLEYFRKADMPK
jgi:hypothetical protein